MSKGNQEKTAFGITQEEFFKICDEMEGEEIFVDKALEKFVKNPKENEEPSQL